MKHLEEIFVKLARYPSITPNDAGAINYIADLLKPCGFQIFQKTFGNTKYSVNNLYARYGSSGLNICFVGHVDVVEPGLLESWIFNPFTPTKHEGRIYARGAVDMKGAIAASIVASLDFIKDYPKFDGSISFLITSDEEGEAEFGTKAMLNFLQEQDELIDLAILGEPASDKKIGDQIKIGRRGSINFILEIIGSQGHVAYPEKATNPIHTLVQIINELTNITLDEGSEFFEPSNLEVTSIDVDNFTSNIIPAKAIAKFNIRFNDLQTQEKLVSLIKKIIEKYTKNYELLNRLSAAVFFQQPTEIFQQIQSITRQSTGINTKFATDGGTSDARFIYKYCPVLEIGAKAENAHIVNEFIELQGLQTLYKVYYDCLCGLLIKR